MPRQKETRPKSNPTPVRFTEEMLTEIDKVADALAMSRQDVIRLSVAAGLKALRALGHDGLISRISEELTSPKPERLRAAEAKAQYGRSSGPGGKVMHEEC